MAGSILANQLNFPGYSVPFMTGNKNNQQWVQFLNYVDQTITGNVSLTGLQSQVNIIGTISNQALTTANEASTTATTAQQTATVAASGVTTNTIAITNINNLIPAFMIKSNNLSDVASVPISRDSLNLNTFPYPIQFDICPPNITRYIGIDRNCVIGANFFGSMATCGNYPTSNYTFNISFVRGLPTSVSDSNNPVYTNIGTLMFVHGGPYPTFIGNQTQLLQGDYLMITTQAINDPTFSQVGITIQVTLS